MPFTSYLNYNNKGGSCQEVSNAIALLTRMISEIGGVCLDWRAEQFDEVLATVIVVVLSAVGKLSG